MDSSTTSSVHINEVGKDEIKKDVYSAWALPPEDVRPRLKKLMNDLRSEFGGPEFEPHVTVVGTISLTESEARDVFNKACEGLKAYNANVERVATGTFFYQCFSFASTHA
ncbi:cyclic phosphodiesterase-like [Olea europaea subsp. europaea]|uniref:Cyclic phosphodiesterase-like n=1 Tax=Olea europaea subsp. europaea TaxID=158383 RepID=A0A8S0UCI1_OLEEU|nr:cyclic phosphodiesterase-like [Olea europaea subsp. europaea]